MKWDIVFTQSVKPYDSYVDWTNLVHLSGYEVCPVMNVDFKRKAIYIICPTNSDFPELCRKTSMTKDKFGEAKFVFWQLERPCAQTNETISKTLFSQQMDRYLESVNFVWTPHQYLSNMDSRAIHVPVGSHPDLREVYLSAEYKPELKYDIALMSYKNKRRAPIYGELQKTWKVSPNAQRAQRDALLRASRVLLTVHQTPSPITEPQRLAIAATHRMPLITEEICCPWPLTQRDYLGAKYKAFIRAVNSWLLLPHESLKKYGEILHKRLCVEYTFRKLVDLGVAETIRRIES